MWAILQINIEKDTTIEGASGVKISIPENSFVDKNGNIVTQDITLEIVEASSVEDYIRNDLQTISNGKLLQSAGMIYIDAKSEGESVFIDENSSLQIEMPTTIYAETYKIFDGKHDKEGNINWEQSNVIQNFLIPLPLSEFDYKYYTKYSFPEKYKGIQYLDSANLNNDKFENTFIATEEFERRFRSMGVDAYYWWEEHETGYGVDRIYGEEYQIKCPLLEVYLQNLDKPLWYSDSIAYDIFRNKEIKDSTERNLGWEDDVVIWYGAELYKKFSNQKLTNVKTFDPKGVDLSVSNALELLINEGYSKQEANEQIQINNERGRIIAERAEIRRRSELNDMTDEVISTSFKKAFNVTSFGWINVDQFFNDPRSKEVELFATINSDSLEYSDVTLIIPNRNIAINGIRLNSNEFTFTQESKEYRKLPVGELAIVVAISMKNEVPYLAIEKFEIKEKQNVELLMTKTTWTGIDEKLSGMNL